MRHALWITALLVLVMALGACGSSGGGTDDLGGADVANPDVPGIDVITPDLSADPGPNDVEGDVPADLPADLPPDVPADLPPDLPTDTPADVPTDTPVDVPVEVDVPENLPYAKAFIQERCAAYCKAALPCDKAEAATCDSDCFAAVVADPGYATQIACWTAVSSCDAYERCFGAPIPDNATCLGMCTKAGDCGFYPSAVLGADTVQCGVQCNGFAWLVAGTPQEAMFTCIVAKVDQCDQMGIASCFPEEENGTCTEMCASLTACDNYPALFADAAACQETCASWDSGSALAAMACASMGNDEGAPSPSSCAAQAACFPPPAELVPGTGPFCSALLDLCNGQPDFKIPNDLTICGWLVTGVTLRLPGVDLAVAATCVEAKTDCADPNAVMTCLVPLYAPCTGLCEAVDACIPDPKPADWPGVAGCADWCSMGHAQDPVAIDQVLACTVAAGDNCEATLACLPNEPQGQ